MTWNIATHNGTVTVESTTGDHRTFRIRRQADDAKFAPGERILEMLIGPNNESDFAGIGFVKDGGKVILWSKHKDKAKLISVLTDVSLWEMRGFRYLIEATCRRCNRKLTTPESIESGIGPTCEGR